MSRKHPLVFKIAVLFCFFFNTDLCAQWGAPYSNSWLNDRHKQEFVKISVNKDGVYRIPVSSLPSSFPKSDPSKFQLWRRGKEVAIISASSTEIVFYGVKNDGKSDELLYRNSSFQPDPSARTNPYLSLYSDESAYFLTNSSSASPSRAKNITRPLDAGQVPLNYHLQTELVTFAEQDSYSPQNNFFTLTLIQSFLESGKGMTSRIYGKNATLTHPLLFGDPTFSYKFENLVRVESQKPEIELLVYGRTNTNNDISLQVGKNASALRTLSENITVQGFGDSKKQYQLNITDDTDIASDGNFTFKLFSNKTSTDWNAVGMYSLTYYKIVYPQSFDMTGKKSKIFTLAPTTDNTSRVSIANPLDNSLIYDITDSENPVLLTGSLTNGKLEVAVPRTANQYLSLLVTTERNEVASSRIQSVSMPLIEPSEFDYLILTTEKLKDGAVEYANYRKSAAGKSYNPLVITISDVYNQFNYGEPSPIAVKRFTDYMLSKGVKAKHNLLLIGNSISYGDSTIKNKELKNQVPTMGYPGSDLLLVSGLAGAKLDVPAIPVGRISATSIAQVRNYLDKVKSYEEAAKMDIGWKKNVLHLSGGKSASEIIQLRSALESLVPLVENGNVGGSVKAFQKQSTIDVEKVNITPEVNEGVGMISYFGHGSPTITDLDMGYVSDATRGYQNINKYPLMYFNGCGVGNIFKGNTDEDYSSSLREPLSADWLCARQKGAIAIIANSYYTFLTSSSTYIKELYTRVFEDQLAGGSSIGLIQKDMALKITSGSYGAYELSNLHQSVLQGDPSMILIRQELPDYTINRNLGIVIRSEANKTIAQSAKLTVDVAVQNLGRNESKVLPVRVRYIYFDGSVDTRNESAGPVSNVDTLHLTFDNTRPVQRIEVKLDPSNTLQESNKANNDSELLIEWDLIKDEKSFPSGPIKDIIAPILNVKFNNEIIKNGETVGKNPVINIVLEDNSLLLSDTSLVDISIKLCGDNSCDFKKVVYSGNQMQWSLLSEKVFGIEYIPNSLIPGEYELLVSSKDLSGNSSLYQYRIMFKVSDSQSAVTITASPNPATDYVRFKIDGDQNAEIGSIESYIYDNRGNVIESKKVIDGIRSWYWMPTGQAGLYIYKILLKDKAGKQNSVTGKIVVTK